MSLDIQVLDSSSILFSSHTGFNLPPQGSNIPLWRMLFLTDGEKTEYGPEFLMKSGANAVSGWRLFEQTLSGPRRSSLRWLAANTHLLRGRRERKVKNIAWKWGMGKGGGRESRRENCSWVDIEGKCRVGTREMGLVQGGPVLQNSSSMHHSSHYGFSPSQTFTSLLSCPAAMLNT